MLNKDRFCCAESCRSAILREYGTMNGPNAYRNPKVCLRPGVWAEEQADKAAEASHEAGPNPGNWACHTPRCGHPDALRL